MKSDIVDLPEGDAWMTATSLSFAGHWSMEASDATMQQQRRELQAQDPFESFARPP